MDSTTPVVNSYDEYGNLLPGTDPARYGWLGGKQRSSETPNGVTLMGVRLYDPPTGRFLSVDPVPGGNANAYEYCNGDPLNRYDLDGKFGWHWRVPWHRNRWSPFGYSWHVPGYARARHFYHRIRYRIHRNPYGRRYYHNPYVQACLFGGAGNGLVAWATKAARRSWYAAGIGCGMGIAARRWQR
ncbi:RHS repeat-associated core domain-containing protein [Streptomyces canus]|uniref:RHS repeat-associated core domain-containing protein n=1 Tax=Streptomyces canus TaxID=58343 RepID=UPI0030DE062A